MTIDIDQIKQGQRTMWSAGDYPDIAQWIESAAEYVVEAAGVGAGDEVLDVDITPELFDGALEPQGKWEALHEDLLNLYRRFNLNDDGSFRGEGEYLVTIARVSA